MPTTLALHFGSSRSPGGLQDSPGAKGESNGFWVADHTHRDATGTIATYMIKQTMLCFAKKENRVNHSNRFNRIRISKFMSCMSSFWHKLCNAIPLFFSFPVGRPTHLSKDKKRAFIRPPPMLPALQDSTDGALHFSQWHWVFRSWWFSWLIMWLQHGSTACGNDSKLHFHHFVNICHLTKSQNYLSLASSPLKNCNLSVRQEHDFKGSTKNPKPKTPLFEDADFPAENSSIGGVTGRLSLAALLRTLVKSKAEDVLVIVVECCRDGF